MSKDQRVGLTTMLYTLLLVVFALGGETFEFVKLAALLAFALSTILFLREERVK